MAVVTTGTLGQLCLSVDLESMSAFEAGNAKADAHADWKALGANLRGADLWFANPDWANFKDANLRDAFRRPGISHVGMEGAGGLDTAKGLVDDPVLAVASPSRCITSTRAAGVPAASFQCRIRYADTV